MVFESFPFLIWVIQHKFVNMPTKRTWDLLCFFFPRFVFLFFNHARHAAMKLADQSADRFTLLCDQTTGWVMSLPWFAPLPVLERMFFFSFCFSFRKKIFLELKFKIIFFLGHCVVQQKHWLLQRLENWLPLLAGSCYFLKNRRLFKCT